MKRLTIRNVPDEVYRAIRREAADTDSSVQTLVLASLIARFTSCVKTDTPLTEESKGLSTVCVNPDTDEDDGRKG